MTLRASGPPEEEEGAALLVRRHGAVVALEKAIERRALPGERVDLERSECGRGMLEPEQRSRRAGERRV